MTTMVVPSDMMIRKEKEELVVKLICSTHTSVNRGVSGFCIWKFCLEETGARIVALHQYNCGECLHASFET